MINIKNLYKSFNSKPVLKGLSLQIYDGETITVMGGSGCGKTVLLKHLVGLMKPDSGSIYIDNIDITTLPKKELGEIQKKFGFVFQSCALFDSLTVFENVAFGLRNLNLTETYVKNRVEECLEHVGLSGTGNLKPAELSGGMRKRLALARAIAYNPKYILYDEPTTGLDPIISETITDLVKYLQKTLKVTSIVVTHDLKCAYKVSNRIAMLDGGKIVEIGSPDEIKNSQNLTVKAFIEISG